MRILITGVTGFMGSHLPQLLVRNHVLCCTKRPLSIFQDAKQIIWIQQDLSEPLDHSRLPKRLDAIIHLAQSNNFRNFPEKAQDIYNININSTFQLLEYGRKIGIKSFILASSGGVCGYKNRSVLENDPPNPLNFYLNSKYVSESIADSYTDFFTTVILRFFFVYGKGQRDRLIPDIIERIRKGQEITIYDKEGSKINPIYISDAVKAIERALNLDASEVINIAGNEIISIKMLSEQLGEMIGKKPNYKFVPAHGDIDLIGNTEKMRIKLDIEPQVKLKEGLDRVLN